MNTEITEVLGSDPWKSPTARWATSRTRMSESRNENHHINRVFGTFEVVLSCQWSWIPFWFAEHRSGSIHKVWRKTSISNMQKWTCPLEYGASLRIQHILKPVLCVGRHTVSVGWARPWAQAKGMALWHCKPFNGDVVPFSEWGAHFFMDVIASWWMGRRLKILINTHFKVLMKWHQECVRNRLIRWDLIWTLSRLL